MPLITMPFERLALLTLGSFLSGSVMYSLLLPLWILGIDVRDAGSDRNPGAWNAVHSCGPALGGVCAALDVLKAALPVYASLRFFGAVGYELIPIALAPVLGHAYSPWLRFNGGKAIAPSFGALLGTVPVCPIFWIMAGVTIVCVTTIKNHAAAMYAAGLIAALVAVTVHLIALPYRIILTLICLLIIHKHRAEALEYIRSRRRDLQ